MDATARVKLIEEMFDNLIVETNDRILNGSADSQCMKFAYQICKDYKVGVDSTKSKTLSQLGKSLPSNVIDANIKKARG